MHPGLELQHAGTGGNHGGKQDAAGKPAGRRQSCDPQRQPERLVSCRRHAPGASGAVACMSCQARRTGKNAQAKLAQRHRVNRQVVDCHQLHKQSLLGCGQMFGDLRGVVRDVEHAGDDLRQHHEEHKPQKRPGHDPGDDAGRRRQRPLGLRICRQPSSCSASSLPVAKRSAGFGARQRQMDCSSVLRR